MIQQQKLTEQQLISSVTAAIATLPTEALQIINDNNGIISGGFFTSHLLGIPFKDVDIYFSDTEQANNTFLKLFKLQYGNRLAYFNPEAKENLRISLYSDPHALVVPFELMRFKTFASAEECINDFDFSVCQIAYQNGVIAFGKNTIKDFNAKKLRIENINGTLRQHFNRIAKYIEKGFSPSKQVFNKLYEYTQNPEKFKLDFEPYEPIPLPNPVDDQIPEFPVPPQLPNRAIGNDANNVFIDAVPQVVPQQQPINWVVAGRAG